MAHKPKPDGKLVKSFEDSLVAVLGESGAKALVKLGGIPEDKFDPRTINASLNKVFGTSKNGLSIMQSNVLKGMSAGLDVEELGRLTAGNFVKSLEAIADRYRLKERTGLGLAGFATAVGSSICCLGPLALALLGLASFSASASLAIDLTSKYKTIEIGVSVVLLFAVIVLQLARRGQCSLSGLRRNLGYVFIPAATMFVSYSALNYWLGVSFLG